MSRFIPIVIVVATMLFTPVTVEAKSSNRVISKGMILASAKAVALEVDEKIDERSQVRKTVSLKCTYYSPGSGRMGSKGAAGWKLKPGYDVAMNRSQMKKLGIKYGDIIKIEYKSGNKKAKKYFSRLYRISDCGCRNGILDLALSSSQAQKTGIRSYGVFRAKVKLYSKDYQDYLKTEWKSQEAM